MYILVFRPSFVLSVKEIKQYYEEQNLPVFGDFKAELDMLLDNVENFPRIYLENSGKVSHPCRIKLSSVNEV